MAKAKKNAPSGAKRLVHNGVIIDIPDESKRKASMTYDGETVAIVSDAGWDWETFRVYLERCADEMAQLTNDLNRKSKEAKAAAAILDENRRAVSIASAGSGSTQAALLATLVADMNQAKRRSDESVAHLEAQKAVIDAAKGRWASGG